MAKILACLMATALAVDQQPPTISMNLDSSVWRKDIGVPTTKRSALDGHAMVCEVGVLPQNCKLPVARAYDHHDGVLKVDKSYYLVMTTEKGVPAPQWTKKTCPVEPCIDYKLRSEWVVEHTACDKSGNCADPVKFTVILRDTVAPVIAPVAMPTTREAAGARPAP